MKQKNNFSFSIIPSVFKNKKGFTLLEVLIAVCIIGLVIIAFLQLNIFNLISLNYSSILTKSNFLLRTKISEIEMADYPETGTNTGEFEKFPGYTWTENVNNFSIDGVRKIEISVKSPDGKTNKVIIYKAR